MREPVFTGACTAIVTPFDQSGAIDYGCFGRLIDQQLDHGVDAICVCGTTGESATLSIREHIAAVAFCVKRVNHRVKVIAGAGATPPPLPSTPPRTPRPAARTPCCSSPPTTTKRSRPASFSTTPT